MIARRQKSVIDQISNIEKENSKIRESVQSKVQDYIKKKFEAQNAYKPKEV